MRRRPLVAVTALRSQQVDGLRFAGHAVSEAIVGSVLRSGATPVLLPPVAESADVDLDVFDGVLIPGGRDVDASLYRPGRKEQAPDVDRLHDEVEMSIVRRCIEQKVPLLAVCRGLQVLNVALGGTLVEDLPVNDVPHRNGFHDVALEPGSRTAAVMGSSVVSVSSYHHQAIEELGAGLVVVGRAADGCIEAVEHHDAPLLAVQWHPEDNSGVAPEHQALFDALIHTRVHS